MKAGAIGIKTKVIVGDAATLYLAEKIARQFGGGIPDAPIDGVLYARKNGNWVEVIADEQIQSNLTETDVESKAFVIGKNEFKAEILGDVVIPEPQFYFTENRQNLVFKKGWLKIPFNFNVNQYAIKNISLFAIFSTGKKLLTCEVSYPSKDTYSSAVDWALYIKDVDNILNENSDFSSIEFRFDLTLDYVSRFNGKKFKLGNGVVFDENAAFHSTAGVATFDKVYPSFNGGKYETVLDPLTNYYSLEYDYTQTYCEIKDASIVSRPYLNASISENVASNPNVLTVASHFGNSFERQDITSGANIFIQNVIAVGARRDSPTDHTGASSYGYGVEFIEVAGKQEMNVNYNGAGDIWFPAGGYNVYQQSPTCAIVSAKFRQIQDATKASWGICRKAARATASNSNSWNIYQGFGVINVAAAIQYIEDNYINNSEYRANLADKIAGENEKYSFVKYEDLDENSPLPKRESDLVYANKSEIPTKTSDLEKDDVYKKSETYTQTEINNKLSAVYKFKGSVPTYAELPTNAENADVYNVEENGVNYAWVESTSSWDSLGGLIGLATLTENGLLSKEDFALLRNLYTADEIDQLLLSFAKLSGGNDFLNTQNFDGRINHKAGEYFYTAASKTTDTVNDTRVINSAGVEIHSICTVLGATKGGGTWANYLKIERQGGVITNISSIDIMQIQAGNGSLILRGFDGVLLRTVLFECMYIDLYGNISTLSSKYQYNATSLTSDTINDTRTSNQSGVKIEEICTAVLAGGANVKGIGTWKGTNAVSPIGGNMIKLTNKTGAASVKGTVIYASPTTDLAFITNPIDGDMPFGIVYDNGIADGSECWVVVSGVAEVLLVNSVASTRSYIAYSSASVAGRIDTAATAPASMLHFREIGHTLESKTAGTNVLCKCVLHFN